MDLTTPQKTTLKQFNLDPVFRQKINKAKSANPLFVWFLRISGSDLDRKIHLRLENHLETYLVKKTNFLTISRVGPYSPDHHDSLTLWDRLGVFHNNYLDSDDFLKLCLRFFKKNWRM